MTDRSQLKQGMAQGLNLTDERSMGVYKMLQDVYPAFAAKLFQGNELMERLVMTGNNPMDILEYPICGRCETIAPYNGYGIKDGKLVLKATCVKDTCGNTTYDPITLREWIGMELKKRVGNDFFQAIEVCIDDIARSMMEKHKANLRAMFFQKGGVDKEKTGIIMPDGSKHLVGTPDVEITHYGNEKPDLKQNIDFRKG